MHHLNHSRQVAKYCAGALSANVFTDEYNELLAKTLILHASSVKFLLPDGGRLYDDKELRALDTSIPLHLPYPCIALEYVATGLRFIPGQNEVNSTVAPKRVCYAVETESDIRITIAFQCVGDEDWLVLPECYLDKVNYLNREKLDGSGRYPILGRFSDPRIPLTDYSDEVGALLCFLNVMNCSNVHVDRSEPKHAKKHVKSALPFDTYHILTIGTPVQAGTVSISGGSRFPREHLRRGHIRRLSDGRTIWINATVVAAGRGAGKVTKDYALTTTSLPDRSPEDSHTV
jgi:hypothetical protein